MVTGCYTLTSGSVVRGELGQRITKIQGNASETRAMGHILVRTSVKIARKYICVLASFSKMSICLSCLRTLTRVGAPCYIGGCTVTFSFPFVSRVYLHRCGVLFAPFRVFFPILYLSDSLLTSQPPTPHILKWSSRLLEIE